MCQEGVGAGIFRHARVFSSAFTKGALAEELRLLSSSGRAHIGSLTLVLLLNLALDTLFVALDLSLNVVCLLLKFVFLELQQRLFLGSIEKLLLHLLNLVFDLLMARFDLFNALVDFNFLAINTILVSLMIVALFSQLLPS